jgi:hypothetical protein
MGLGCGSSGRVSAQHVQSPECKSQYQSPAPVAHTCNPIYSGGRDKEDPQFEASPRETYLEKTHHTKKWDGGVAQCVGLEFKP